MSVPASIFYCGLCAVCRPGRECTLELHSFELWMAPRSVVSILLAIASGNVGREYLYLRLVVWQLNEAMQHNTTHLRKSFFAMRKIGFLRWGWNQRHSAL